MGIVADRTAAAREVYRYSFGATTYDGTGPAGPLVARGGSLYGVTGNGGANFAGTVFKLTPIGQWYRESILFNFGGSAGADESPVGGLVDDGAGNFFGVATVGGTWQQGVVFELSPSPSGYVQTILYNFLPYTVNDVDYPLSPNGSLVRDASGALYGTTAGGGLGPPPGNGTVFKLTPTTSGYTESLLYAFGTNSNDGLVPRSGLAIDKTGALYGTAIQGGAHGAGTVFKLTPTPVGYRERTLHAFGENLSDGATPFAGVILNGAGVVFGTTYGGGINNGGTVFALTPTQGIYHETVLHRFGAVNYDGLGPFGRLVAGPNGNLYGTTEVSGNNGGGGGVAFELISAANGGCREVVLHQFGSSSNDGLNPFYTLIFNWKGNLFGTTPAGGKFGDGTTFELELTP
jgi:uncharacterized repeat protein (TIGR03803 family)